MPGGRHDVCVVGSGAAGSVVAAELVGAGADVIVIEQGDHVPPGARLLDLIPTFETARARTPEGEWVDSGYPWTACAVGGGTRFYAGVSLRLREIDFDVSEHAVPESLPPAWPFAYAVLKPDYDAIERALGIAAAAGADPTGPPAPAASQPPHQPGLRGARVLSAARLLGLRPFPLPMAINSRDGSAGPACRELTACTDHVCPIGAKRDAFEVFLAALAGRPNFTLSTMTKAVRLREDQKGRVSSLECVDVASGRRSVIYARTFVVAANAVQSAALLLRSASRYSALGLGNEHDMVGRGLCLKVSQYVRGALREPLCDLLPESGRHTSVAVADYYLAPDCPTGLGGMIYEAAPTLPREARDGSLIRLECLLADHPMAANRVRIDRGRADRFGLPRVVMDYRPLPVDLSRLAFLRAQARRILIAGGAQSVAAEPLDFTLGSAHLHGTCRMGTDPRTSVCDPSGRVHGMDNLYVADGALMPYPGGVNPTLTIQALARRVARLLRA